MQEINFNELMAKHFATRRRKEAEYDGTIGANAVGGCMRQNWFRLKCPKPADISSLGVFEMGNLAHENLAAIIDKHLDREKYEVEKIEFEVDYPINIYNPDTKEELRIGGRLDGLVTFKDRTKLVLEFKSTSTFKVYDKKTKQKKDILTEPKKDHVLQAQIYMRAVRANKAQIVYVLKNNFSEVRSFTIDFNLELFALAVKRARELAKHIIENTIPIPEAKYDKDEKWRCNPLYCQWKSECDLADEIPEDGEITNGGSSGVAIKSKPAGEMKSEDKTSLSPINFDIKGGFSIIAPCCGSSTWHESENCPNQNKEEIADGSRNNS